MDATWKLMRVEHVDSSLLVEVRERTGICHGGG
jgi:hypothetical protein